MALVRRRFVAAIIVDAVFLAFVVLSALVHALSRGHRDADDRSAIAPFAAHALHAATGLVGLVAIVVPAASAPSATLVGLAPLAGLGDAAAAVAQARQALVERHASSSSLSEYTLFAALALMLLASSANLYWTARLERATFVPSSDARHTDGAAGNGGFGGRRRQQCR